MTNNQGSGPKTSWATITYGGKTDEENLRRWAGHIPVAEIANRLNRQKTAVYVKAATLRKSLVVKTKKRTNRWTRITYGEQTDQANLEQWAHEQMPIAEIASRLHRTERAVRDRMRKSGLPIPPIPRKPPNPDLERLRKMAGKFSRQDIADCLGRTVGAVDRMASEQGLSLKTPNSYKGPHTYTDAELDVLRANRHLPDAALAELLPGRSRQSVWARRKSDPELARVEP